MKYLLKRVNQSDWVNSIKKTKMFLNGFVLVTAGLLLFSYGLTNPSIASDITIDNIVNLTNQSRLAAGKNALTVNAKLSRAAESKAEDMIANNYFSHTSPTGVTPWSWIQKENYDYNYAGENLAMDFQSAEKMEDAWMASPTHRANILNERYKEIGVAVKEGIINGHKTIIAVVMFGSGDNNLSNMVSEKISDLKRSQNAISNNIPVLPAGEEKKGNIISQQPMITSPQSGETIADKEVRIIGRAKPGKSVSVYDNGDFIDSATTDSSGWFSVIEKNLPEGSHRLTLEYERNFLETETEFFVDRKRPNIDFHLFVDENNSRQLYLEASVDKNNCILEFNRESREIMRNTKTWFVVDSDKLSSILRVRDLAGNKNFRQVNLVNYYYPVSVGSFSGKLAMLLAPRKNIFVAGSAREAMKNNLGIATGGVTNNY